MDLGPRRPMGQGRGMVAAIGLLVAGLVLGILVRPYLGSLCRAIGGTGQDPPQPMLAELWASKTGQFRILDSAETAPAVVYLGDSSTDWMALSEFVHFEGGHVLNRGINGDTTAGILARIRSGFPRDVRLCFLLIGYNDLARGATPARTAERIATICEVLQDHHKVGYIVLESVLPDMTRPNLRIEELNSLLEALATQREGASFLDLYSGFLRDGQQDVSLFADHGHPNEHGVQRRLRLERDHLARIAPDLSGQVSFVIVE